MVAARSRKLHPPAKRTKELVQSFLLIGKNGAHAIAAPKQTTPAIASSAALRAVECAVRSQIPASKPKRAVAIDGRVDNRPSGSNVWAYRWSALNIWRSSHAA